MKALGIGGAFSETDAVGSVMIEVEIEGDMLGAQCLGEEEAVLDGDGGVLPSLPDEAGWSIGADLFFVGIEVHELGRGIGT